MIATHARATTNDKVRARLEEAGRRLQVIASTYNNLYEPGAVIDMADHLRKVCAFVEGGVASSNTRISVDSVQTKWPVDRVVPLSLIANELLTNAVKHAPPDQDLAIEVSLQRVGDLMRFSVLTKNVKLPADFDAANSGLGLRLASMLGKQLGGTLTTHACPMRCSCSSFRSDREFIERCEHTFGGVAEELSVGRCPLAAQPVQLGQQRLVDRLEPLQDGFYLGRPVAVEA